MAQEVFLSEGRYQRFDLGDGLAQHERQGQQIDWLAEDRCCLKQAPLFFGKARYAGGDERAKRTRYRDLAIKMQFDHPAIGDHQ